MNKINKATIPFLIVCLIAASGIITTVTAQKAKAIVRHGVQLGKKKMYGDAIKQFDRATRIYDKSSAKAFHNKGYAYELKGNKKVAIKNYAEAFRRWPYIVSGERLGYLYYVVKDYENAVTIGERVLKIDPNNKKVPRWLSDAYIKRLAIKKKQEEIKKKKLQEEKKRIEDALRKDKRQREKMAQILKASIDITIKNGYHFGNQDNSGIELAMGDRGVGLDILESVNVHFTPTANWTLDIIAANPWLGALTNPGILVQQEMLEGSLTLGGFRVGVGLMFSHFWSNRSFGNDMILFDYKTGFILGMQSDKSKTETTIRFYPRLLPRDNKSSTEETFDVDLLEIIYKYNISHNMSYYSIIKCQDFYTFDHNQEISDYWGVYDIGIGVKLGKIDRTNNKRDFTFSLELLARLYFMDNNNTKPYDITNGQGLAGLNSSKWLKGEPFSAYEAWSVVFNFKVEEQLTTYLFLYQKISFEWVDYRVGHHELNLQLGIGTIL